jgi:hypothetical protein
MILLLHLVLLAMRPPAPGLAAGKLEVGVEANIPVPSLIWSFDGDTEQVSSVLPDSEATHLISRFGFVEGPPRGPRYLAFDRGAQASCAVALDSAATVLSTGMGRIAVLTATKVDGLDEHCQVRFSHPAESAAVLLDGSVLAVADQEHVFFLDSAGKKRDSARLRGAPILVAAADGGNLLAATKRSVSVFDPWGRRLGRIETRQNHVTHSIAAGPDRIYLGAGNQVASHALDGALLWTEKLGPDPAQAADGVEVTGLWAWPDGRGVLVAIAESKPGRHQAVRGRHLEAHDPAGGVRWRLPLGEAQEQGVIEVAFASESGDVAVTAIDGERGRAHRASIFILTPDGRIRGLLQITAETRTGGARLSSRGRYLLVNTTDSGLLRLYTAP